MPISNIPAELWVGGQLTGRGTCHLMRRNGDKGGTISGLAWVDEEPDLAGQAILLRLATGRDLQATIVRQSRPEGRTVIRFAVP